MPTKFFCITQDFCNELTCMFLRKVFDDALQHPTAAAIFRSGNRMPTKFRQKELDPL